MSKLTSNNRSDRNGCWITIPKLARRLGVTAPSIREWIRRGYIEAPTALPVTGEHVYAEAAAQRIERWYYRRTARGGTRGPGAVMRREQAQRWLSERGLLDAHDEEAA